MNYKYRMHDPRVGRFFAVDPLSRDYPWNSPYAFSENKVIAWLELEGLESYPTNAPKGDPIFDWDHQKSHTYIKTLSNGVVGPYGPTIQKYLVDGVSYWVYEDWEYNRRNWQYYDEKTGWTQFDPKFRCTSCEINQIAGTIYENSAKYGGPVLKVVGGIVAVAAAIPTGGASLGALPALGIGFTVVSGTFATATGVTELVLRLQDQDALADKIPSGYLNATIGIVIKTTVDDVETQETINVVLNIIEGAATMTFKNPTDLDKLSNAISTGGVIETIVTPNETEKKKGDDTDSGGSETTPTPSRPKF